MLRIIYPYNEKLPIKTAHDVYIFHNTNSLAASGSHVNLLCGQGGMEDGSLFAHYRPAHFTHGGNFQITRLPIIRKSTPLRISWNLPFFFYSQKAIAKEKPDLVIVSVLKQANYHFSRKVKGVKYVYEAHELAWYPFMDLSNEIIEKIAFEKNMLQNADLITVTTQAMKQILTLPPYSLKNRIEVVPLAVNVKKTKKHAKSDPTIHLTYVGQLYSAQGLQTLIHALKEVDNTILNVVGGNPEQIQTYEKMTKELGIQSRVIFHGFQPPSKLEEFISSTDAFVAPFEGKGRKPFTAHTKLLEYMTWERPVIAPDLPIVHEIFPKKKGLVPFQADNISSLAAGIRELQKTDHLKKLQAEIEALPKDFTWESRSRRYLDLLLSL